MEDIKDEKIILKNFFQTEFVIYAKKVENKKNSQSKIAMSNMALSSFYDFCRKRRYEYDITDKNDIRELAILYIAQLLNENYTPHSIFAFISIMNSIYTEDSTNRKINAKIIKDKQLREALNDKLDKLEKKTKKKKDRIGMRRFKVGKQRQMFSVS